MKHLLFFLLMLQLPSVVQAQNINFTDTTNEWYVYNKFGASSAGVFVNEYTIAHHYYSGKQTINSTDYQILFSDWKTASYYVYNSDTQGINIDSGTKQVYVRRDSVTNDIHILYGANDTTEYLLYTHNVQVGDTLPRSLIGGYKIVDSVDTVVINNASYRRYFIICRGGTTAVDYVYVDELGSLSEPYYLTTTFSVPMVRHSSLICFKNQYGYLQSNDVVLNCADTNFQRFVNGNTSNIPIVSKSITPIIYPQPAHSSVNIKIPESAVNSTISLYDVMGKAVLSKTLASQETTFATDRLAPGIYYYKINTGDGELYKGKLIIQ